MAASLVCATSPNIAFFLAARIIQGIGSAMMMPGSLAIITAYFGPSERGRAIGMWSAATTTVLVIGPILGGAPSSAGLWRAVFLIKHPAGNRSPSTAL